MKTLQFFAVYGIKSKGGSRGQGSFNTQERKSKEPRDYSSTKKVADQK